MSKRDDASTAESAAESADEPIRLDVWLWRTRFFKTRTLTTQFVNKGRVRVTRSGQAPTRRKPAFAINVDDVITYTRSGHVICVRILGIPTRRGPASEAQGLYEPVDMGETRSWT